MYRPRSHRPRGGRGSRYGPSISLRSVRIDIPVDERRSPGRLPPGEAEGLPESSVTPRPSGGSQKRLSHLVPLPEAEGDPRYPEAEGHPSRSRESHRRSPGHFRLGEAEGEAEELPESSVTPRLSGGSLRSVRLSSGGIMRVAEHGELRARYVDEGWLRPGRTVVGRSRSSDAADEHVYIDADDLKRYLLADHWGRGTSLRGKILHCMVARPGRASEVESSCRRSPARLNISPEAELDCRTMQRQGIEQAVQTYLKVSGGEVRPDPSRLIEQIQAEWLPGRSDDTQPISAPSLETTPPGSNEPDPGGAIGRSPADVRDTEGTPATDRRDTLN